ncbi:hypothetical protein [Streptomyces sp. NPDC007172]|uniref:hypothetical protein n=1 Tax=Streptomyces sp. NPDC007172 TaxID=3364776 RepID=UPI00368C8FC5
MTKPERPASEQPLADQLVSGRDVPERPGTEQPGAARDVPEQPGTARDVPARAASDQVLSGREAPGRGVPDQPPTGHDVPERAVPDQSVSARETAPEQPFAGQAGPGTGQHLGAAPASERALSDRPLSERPGADQPLSERPASVPSAAEGRVPEQAGRRAGTEAGGAVDDDTVLPPHEREKLQLRLQHAVGGFVDEPRSAVEEAASAVDALTERIIETLGERRGTLRATWQDASGGSATEDMRMALREYRRLAERLLSL